MIDWAVKFMQHTQVYRTVVVSARTDQEAIKRALEKRRICIGFYTNIVTSPL